MNSTEWPAQVDDLRKCNHGVAFNRCKEHWIDYMKYLGYLCLREMQQRAATRLPRKA